jgi:hypothetical protein
MLYINKKVFFLYVLLFNNNYYSMNVNTIENNKEKELIEFNKQLKENEINTGEEVINQKAIVEKHKYNDKSFNKNNNKKIEEDKELKVKEDENQIQKIKEDFLEIIKEYEPQIPTTIYNEEKIQNFEKQIKEEINKLVDLRILYKSKIDEETSKSEKIKICNTWNDSNGTQASILNNMFNLWEEKINESEASLKDFNEKIEEIITKLNNYQEEFQLDGSESMEKNLLYKKEIEFYKIYKEDLRKEKKKTIKKLQSSFDKCYADVQKESKIERSKYKKIILALEDSDDKYKADIKKENKLTENQFQEVKIDFLTSYLDYEKKIKDCQEKMENYNHKKEITEVINKLITDRRSYEDQVKINQAKNNKDLLKNLKESVFQQNEKGENILNSWKSSLDKLKDLCFQTEKKIKKFIDSLDNTEFKECYTTAIFIETDSYQERIKTKSKDLQDSYKKLEVYRDIFKKKYNQALETCEKEL